MTRESVGLQTDSNRTTVHARTLRALRPRLFDVVSDDRAPTSRSAILQVHGTRKDRGGGRGRGDGGDRSRGATSRSGRSNLLFPCPEPWCSKTFTRTADMERHRRRQHNPDPRPEDMFGCPHCSKLFFERWMQNKHSKKCKLHLKRGCPKGTKKKKN